MKRWFVLVLIPLLTACATVPTSSPLHVVKDGLPQGSGDSVRVIARPPTAGMSPTEVVAGFIAANASPDNDYAIARKYLARDFANAWAPETVSIVDASQLQISESSTTTVSFAFPQLGVLTAQKRLEWSDAPLLSSAVFSVQSINGEWRISGAPATAFLSATDFARNFRSSSAYFFDSDFSSLVPDPVWLPVGNRTAATRMMRVLLAGPAGPLAAATQSSFPPGTTLAIAAVTVANGTASVAFNSTPLQMNAAQRRLLLAQVVYSLTNVNGVQQVRVTAEGQALPGNNLLYLRRSDFPEFAADAATIKDPFFSVHSNVLSRGLSNPVDVGIVGNVQSLAVSTDGASVATVAAGVARVARITDVAAAEVLGKDFESVEFDHQGALWLKKLDGTLWYRDGVRQPQKVLGLPVGAKVLSSALSPEGSRIAVVVRTSAGQVLRTAAVLRTSSSVSIGPLVRIERSFNSVADVSWLNSETLLVLARRNVENENVYQLTISGGNVHSLGAPTGAVHVMSEFAQPIVVLTSQGLLWQYSFGQWRSLHAASAANYA